MIICTLFWFVVTFMWRGLKTLCQYSHLAWSLHLVMLCWSEIWRIFSFFAPCLVVRVFLTVADLRTTGGSSFVIGNPSPLIPLARETIWINFVPLQIIVNKDLNVLQSLLWVLHTHTTRISFTGLTILGKTSHTPGDVITNNPSHLMMEGSSIFQA